MDNPCGTVVVLKGNIYPIVVMGVIVEQDSIEAHRLVRRMNIKDLNLIFLQTLNIPSIMEYILVWDENFIEAVEKVRWRLHASYLLEYGQSLDISIIHVTGYRALKEESLSSHIAAWCSAKLMLFDYAVLYHKKFPKLLLPITYVSNTSAELKDAIYQMKTIPPFLRKRNRYEYKKYFWDDLADSPERIKSSSQRYFDSDKFKTDNRRRRFRGHQASIDHVKWIHNMASRKK